MTARDVLDEYEVAVDHHPWVDGQWHVHEAAHAMLAALRAVLDELDRAQREYQKSREACRGSVWSPRPVVYEPDVRAIIAEALGSSS